jgi:hypothetical protein
MEVTIEDAGNFVVADSGSVKLDDTFSSNSTLVGVDRETAVAVVVEAIAEDSSFVAIES